MNLDSGSIRLSNLYNLYGQLSLRRKEDKIRMDALERDIRECQAIMDRKPKVNEMKNKKANKDDKKADN